MVDILNPTLAPELRGIFLNACNTESMARLIHRYLPQLSIVCWGSVVENKAATAFSKGFFGAIAADEPGAVSVRRAFDAGVHAFQRANFCEGDPCAYLHDASHEHRRAGRFFRNCPGCKPPVHGVPVLISPGVDASRAAHQ